MGCKGEFSGILDLEKIVEATGCRLLVHSP